jgi:hypothetical protein
MPLARLLHTGKLTCIELVSINRPPVVGGRIHGKAGRRSAVRADDHGKRWLQISNTDFEPY